MKCVHCNQDIDGTMIGAGDGSMKDGGKFAHPECYYRARVVTLEAESRSARKDAIEEAAQVAERDVDWVGFGKRDIEQWDGGPDAVRDYRLGIAAGRSIAASIRALASDGKRGEQ